MSTKLPSPGINYYYLPKSKQPNTHIHTGTVTGTKTLYGKNVMLIMFNVPWAHVFKHLVPEGDTIFGSCGIFDIVTLLTEKDNGPSM